MPTGFLFLISSLFICSVPCSKLAVEWVLWDLTSPQHSIFIQSCFALFYTWFANKWCVCMVYWVANTVLYVILKTKRSSTLTERNVRLSNLLISSCCLLLPLVVNKDVHYYTSLMGLLRHRMRCGRRCSSWTRRWGDSRGTWCRWLVSSPYTDRATSRRRCRGTWRPARAPSYRWRSLQSRASSLACNSFSATRVLQQRQE